MQGSSNWCLLCHTGSQISTLQPSPANVSCSKSGSRSEEQDALNGPQNISPDGALPDTLHRVTQALCIAALSQNLAVSEWLSKELCAHLGLGGGWADAIEV